MRDIGRRDFLKAAPAAAGAIALAAGADGMAGASVPSATATQATDVRGRADSLNRSRHNQSYKPVLEQDEAVGHAVNCASLMVSLTDVGVLTGLDAYLDAARRMWRDVVDRKMDVTGGIGSTGNEGFGEPYSLPNISAYSETCAVLMFTTLNHRLFLATGDSQYVDVLERGLYNNAVDGVSMSGERFFSNWTSQLKRLAHR
jgi:uncharacterized protein